VQTGFAVSARPRLMNTNAPLMRNWCTVRGPFLLVGILAMTHAERHAVSLHSIVARQDVEVDRSTPPPTEGGERPIIDAGSKDDFPAFGSNDDFPSLDNVLGKDKDDVRVMQFKEPPLDAIDILTWNVKNIVAVDDASVVNHIEYIKSVLTSILRQKKTVAVIVFQEVSECSLLSGAFPTNFACVESTTNLEAEARDSQMALGNVIFYRTDLFEAENKNRLVREDGETDYVDAKNHKHTTESSSLQEYWKDACESWKNYNSKCRRQKPEGVEMDLPRVPTVDLRLSIESGLWSTEFLEAFPRGFRIVAVHLFSGGMWINDGTLTAQGVLDRRKFQMRALFHLVDYWNAKDAEQGAAAPTTVYAGDYNTAKIEDLKAVLQPAADYGVALWCPVSGRTSLCQSATSTVRSSKGSSFSHRRGQLDTFVVDLRSPRANFNAVTKNLPYQTTVKVFNQEKLKAIPNNCGDEGCNSDHQPVLLSIKW